MAGSAFSSPPAAARGTACDSELTIAHNSNAVSRGHSSHWLRGLGRRALTLFVRLAQTCKLRHIHTLLARYCLPS